MAQRQLYSGLDLYDWRGTGPNGRTKAVDVDKWQQNQEDIRHLPGAFPVQSVVITRWPDHAYGGSPERGYRRRRSGR